MCLGGWQGLHEGGSAPGLNNQIPGLNNQIQMDASVESLVCLRPGNDAKIILGPLD